MIFYGTYESTQVEWWSVIYDMFEENLRIVIHYFPGDVSNGSTVKEVCCYRHLWVIPGGRSQHCSCVNCTILVVVAKIDNTIAIFHI